MKIEFNCMQNIYKVRYRTVDSMPGAIMLELSVIKLFQNIFPELKS